MSPKIILASGSEIRRTLFANAGVMVSAVSPKIDEEMIKNSLCAEQARPRDIADTLAEYKARKVASKYPDCVVIACDQVLDLKGRMFSKPADAADAKDQLKQLQGKTHKLHSAAVIYHEGKPIWRFVGMARMTMRPLSEDYVAGYVGRTWDRIQHCVGCYQLEGEGVRLFNKVEGDYFTVLGLPLIEVLSYLGTRGCIDA